jgi:protein transport protein SEC24
MSCRCGHIFQFDVSLFAGGKCVTFVSSLPSLGPGALKNRDNPRLLGTDKEHELLRPATEWFVLLLYIHLLFNCVIHFLVVVLLMGGTRYRQMAVRASHVHIGFDLFCCTSSSIDIATLNCLPGTTGGQVTRPFLLYDSL